MIILYIACILIIMWAILTTFINYGRQQKQKYERDLAVAKWRVRYHRASKQDWKIIRNEGKNQ